MTEISQTWSNAAHVNIQSQIALLHSLHAEFLPANFAISQTSTLTFMHVSTLTRSICPCTTLITIIIVNNILNIWLFILIYSLYIYFIYIFTLYALYSLYFMHVTKDQTTVLRYYNIKYIVYSFCICI